MHKRILIVDDDPDDQSFLKEAISELMPVNECNIAGNGVQAMKFISKEPTYDIILLDLNMPLMNGFETLKAIKRTDGYQQTPVVILSTSSDENDIRRSRDLGATYYIVKPTSLDILVAELKPFLVN